MGLDDAQAGKSLIAWREGPTDTFVSVPLNAYTSRTITNLRALQMELERVRASGWSSARGEYEDDLLGVGAPVRDHLGEVIAAVTISAPCFRVPDASTREIGLQVRAAAERISTALGYIPAPSANALTEARR